METTLSDLLKQAGVQPTIETPAEPPVVPVEPTLPNNEPPVVQVEQQNPPQSSLSNNGDSNDEQDLDNGFDSYVSFAKSLGINKEFVNDGREVYTIEDLVALSKEAMQPYQKYEEIEIVKDFYEHLNRGGSVDTFRVLQQKSTVFQSMEIPRDNVDIAEQVLRQSMGLKGVQESMINIIVENVKDNGTIFDVANGELDYLKSLEQKQNEELERTVYADIEREKQEAITFFKNLNTAFEQNNFNGFSLPVTDLDTIKTLSLPDKNGIIGIDQLAQELTPEQTALVNYAAYKIAKGEPLNITFPKKQSGLQRPVVKLANLSSSGGANNGKKILTVEELVSHFETAPK